MTARRAITLAFALAAGSAPCEAAQLPIPCAPGACGTTSTFVSPGATGTPKVTAVQSGNTLTVNQKSNSAILNWASFNVSADGKVTFNQPSASAVALNRIFQSNPSAIFGQVSANGQIYLINSNGFIFGSTARVNTAGLIASTLGMTDDVFNAGILAPQVLQGNFGNRAALSGDVGVDGNVLPGGDSPSASVEVQAGAQISTPGGRLLLAAPNVTNAGSLSAADGQVVLAAGQNVYLQASTDASLRGLIVEVDGNNAAAMNQVTTATNAPTGSLSAARGNVTLVGLAVNQDGRISATTTVSENGSVRLEAASGAQAQGGGNVPITLTPTIGGTLELGPKSSIEILPELASSATAVSDQTQLPSQVTLAGQSILMHGGNITAPSGTLAVTASADPGVGVATDGNSQARIRIDAGTTIDLSGSSVALPVTANLLSIQLRANELADDPDQRNGPLRGQTVYVDARVGSPLINAAAFDAALAAVPETIGQRTTAGGSASFESEGDVVIQPGAKINVSGGQTLYQGGTFQTSLLVGTNGQLYDIGKANPLLSYSGVLNPTFTQTYNAWGVQNIVPTPGLSHYEASYVQGAPAGSISIAAPSLVLQGSFVGHAVSGAQQRTGTPVAGGTLTIGLAGGLPSSLALDFLAPSIELVQSPTPVVVSDSAALPPQTAQLSPDYLSSGGFTSTRIYSNGNVTVMPGVPLNLNAGGSLLIDAPRVGVLSSVTAPGGSITLENSQTVAASSDYSRYGVQIGNGVTLDVSGQWTNDLANALSGNIGTGPVILKGGSITLSPGQGNGVGKVATLLEDSELVLGNEVTLRANGGAWLQSNNVVAGGAGGSISLVGSPLGAGLQVGSADVIEAFGTQGARGGSFSLSAPRILLANGESTWAPAQRVDDLAPASGGNAPGGIFKVYTSLFDQFGFSTISLVANGAVPANAASTDVLVVPTGTQVTPLTRSLELQPSYLIEPTGGSIASFATVSSLPESIRPVTNVALSVAPVVDDPSLLMVGLLDLQEGASIVSDPGASIALSGVGGVFVGGRLRAPGGTISLATPSPSGTPDPGYMPGLRIELGSHAVLDASGTFVPTLPNDAGLILGAVLGGGSVDLLANRGSVVTDLGSQIDIAGTSHALDINTDLSLGAYTRYLVPSAAGSLLVRAPESVSLLGAIAAHAGIGNYGNPAGGALEVDLTRSEFFSAGPGGGTPFPTTPRIIELLASLPANAKASDPGSGRAELGVANLEADGIDSLRLEAGDEILFSSATPLNLARQLILDAPAIGVSPGVSSTINTSYLMMGNTLPAPSTAVPIPGTGTLQANAAQIDLLGSFAFQDASAVRLSSRGDITLRGVFSLQGEYGNLALDGNLTLSAARVFPATGTAFSIATEHAASDPASLLDTVSITQSSPAGGVPLSAGGDVSITADRIVSSGTLVAPFGTINLTASDSLDLERGSVTSVSGAGTLIPFGQTSLGGQEWNFLPADGNPLAITSTPSKTIALTAPTITVGTGAKVNLQGGGDVYAYEWVPGTGGTTDALGAGPSSGLYAVLPSLRGRFAPYDPQETAAAGINGGASIYLSGGGGLAAGIYPLLPARDALLPGAFLVQVQSSGFGNIVPGAREYLQDGTPVIAGYLTFGTTGLHSGGYAGVAVWPGSYGQALAQYNVNTATSFFSALATLAGATTAPPLPADAGALNIAVSADLNFLGEVVGNLTGSTGAGSKISLQAPALEITATAASPSPSGVVSLAGSVIQSWKAGDLVLGGAPSADGTSIDVTANTVTIDNGAQVFAQQVILVANQAISLKSGAQLLSASAAAGGRAPNSLPATEILSLESTNPGGAGLLAVSDLALPVVARSGSASGGATISIGSGATVGSLGALSVDGPGGVSIAGTLHGTGASWSLASGSIGFVGNGSSTESLEIGSALQSQMARAGALRLASEGSIDLYVPVQLGASSGIASPSLSALTLSASTLIDEGTAAGTVFAAKTLTLEGTSGAPIVASTAPSSADSVVFAAHELDFGAGSMTINGFRDLTLRATAGVVGQAVGGLSTGGSVTIDAPVFTALSQAQTSLSTSSDLAFNSIAPSGSPLSLMANLGGAISLSARNLTLAGSVSVPAGVFQAQATENLTVAGGARIDAGGRLVTIEGKTFGAEGGQIKLTAGGNLTLAGGSALNVSGTGDAPAGGIELTAQSQADLQANLTGHAGSGSVGGSFAIDAGSLVQGLTPLAQTLGAGGFTAEESIIAHTGNLVLAPGAQLTANQVELVADSGQVEVGGTIQAPSASLRGLIGLFGATGVSVDASGTVSASNSGGSGGGEIDLGTNSGGSIVLANGSRLSASGIAGGGVLLARAPIMGSDVALTDNGASLQGFGQILIEPIVIMPISNSPTAADFAAAQSAAASAVAGVAGNVVARLNPTGILPLSIRGALDLTQSGDVTLLSSLDLYPVSSTGAPLDVAFRVGGALNLGSAGNPVTISDGFYQTSLGLGLSAVASSSFRLIAGADASSPDPLAVLPQGNVNLTLASGSIVRTGTGEIDLRASGDLVFSSGGTAPLVYTAGINPLGASGQPIGGVKLGSSQYNFNFPSQGGAIRLQAGENIDGAPVQQSVTDWMLRDGTGAVKRPVEWGPELDQLSWNVSSLGGGDVSVRAGGSISELSVAAADNNYQPKSAPTATYTPSGGFQVTAGGDIGSSQFFIASGTGLLRAGGAFSAIEPVPGDAANAGSLLALDSAQVTIEARTGITFDAIENPSAATQDLVANSGANSSYFYTYTNQSSVLLQSTGGTVSLLNDPLHEAALMGNTGSSSLQQEGPTYPGTLMVRSLEQDVNLPEATLFPAPNGQIEIVAGRDINAPQTILLSDAVAALVPTSATPVASATSAAVALQLDFSGNVHLDDPQAGLIVAGRDITALALSIPKPVDILAGRDIDNLQLRGENLQSNQLTLVSAGRDLVDSESSFVGIAAGITVGGPGRLNVLAGRNIGLGFSQGIVTVGNTLNPNLPTSTGADLTAIAGLGSTADHYADFVSNIIATDSTGTNQGLLVSYVESLTGETGLTYKQASAQFDSLSADQQRPLINEVFFDELSISGIQANTEPKLGFSLGYKAIDTLFPDSRTAVATGSSPYQGDISLTFSRIYTLTGGDITLLVPGGSLDVGLANAPSNLPVTKTPSQLGIVTQGTGDVNIYSKGDVNVNASRIFTLGGGNILIWSDEGSIDAGKGSKSSVSAPPPQVLVDSSGNITLSFSGAVAGSGIRTIQTDPAQTPGNVNLIAPEGTVNAGDAGIGAAGNINIAAQHVIGLNNIQFGGTSTGVPSQVSNIGVTLSGAASSASSASNASTTAASATSEKEAATPLAQTALAWLDVFVTGLGEENCRPDDLECLKRQKLGPK